MSARAVVLSAVALSGCGPAELVPDVSYAVTVSSAVVDNELVTTCVDEGAVFNKSYTYELFFDGSTAEMRIDGEGFAAGTRSGCNLAYESAIWLEERDEGDLRWQLVGEAVYEGATGGCDLADGLDWEGTEIIEVTESEDEAVPEGCTYEMVTEGTLKGG